MILIDVADAESGVPRPDRWRKRLPLNERGPVEGGAHSTGRKLLWFAGLWLAGVATVSIVAYAIRWMVVP